MCMCEKDNKILIQRQDIINELIANNGLRPNKNNLWFRNKNININIKDLAT